MFINRTIGVSPIVSVIESKTRPRPGCGASATGEGWDFSGATDMGNSCTSGEAADQCAVTRGPKSISGRGRGPAFDIGSDSISRYCLRQQKNIVGNMCDRKKFYAKGSPCLGCDEPDL